MSPGNGTYHPIENGVVQAASVTAENASFAVVEQTLSVEDTTVRAGSPANLTVESNRSAFACRLSSPDLSTETLASIPGATATADGVIVQINESRRSLAVPLGSVAPGEYTITASAVDSTAQTTATIGVESWVTVETGPLPAGPDATIEGDSSLDEGSDVVVTVDPGGADRKVVATTTATGHWTTTVDLSGVQPGTYTIAASAVAADAATTRTVSVEPLLAVATTAVHRGPNATIVGQSMLADGTPVDVSVGPRDDPLANATTHVENGTWSADMNLGAVETGTYTVTVRAADRSASASSTVRVDPRATVSNTTLPTGPSATITGTSIDESVTLELLDDGETLANATTTVVDGTWAVTWNVTTVDPGTYTLSVSSGPVDRTMGLRVVEQTARFGAADVTRQAITFDRVTLTHGGTVEIRAGNRSGPAVGSRDIDGDATTRTIAIQPGPTVETVVAVAVRPTGTLYRDRNGSVVTRRLALPGPLVDATNTSTETNETVTLTATVENATEITLTGIPDDWSYTESSVEATGNTSVNWNGSAVTISVEDPQSAVIAVTLDTPPKTNGTVALGWRATRGQYRTVAPASVTVRAPTVTVDDAVTDRGDVATIDVHLDDTSSGWVRIGHRDVAVLANVRDVDADGDLSLHVNTYTVRSHEIPLDTRIWASGPDRVTSVRNVSTTARNRSAVRPLDPVTYLVRSAPWIGDSGLLDPTSTAVLDVDTRETSALTLRSGGPADSLDSIEAIRTERFAGHLPNRDRVAASDRIVVDLEATGLDGALALQDEGSTTENVLSAIEDPSLGISLRLHPVVGTSAGTATNGSRTNATRTNATRTNATRTNATRTNATGIDLDADALTAFESTDRLYLVLDGTALGLVPGQQYEVAFTIAERSPLADTNVTVSDRVQVLDEPVTLSGRLAAAPNQTLAGVTTVPEGKTLGVTLQDESGDTIVDREVTVGDGGNWSLSADLPTDAFGTATLITTGPIGQVSRQTVGIDRPEATLSIANATGDRVVVESVRLAHGGQIVIHEATASGPVVGSSAVLGTTATTATIPVSNVSGETTLVAVAHFSTGTGPGPVYRTATGAPVSATTTVQTADDSETEDTGGGSIGDTGFDIDEETTTKVADGGAVREPITTTETPETTTATPTTTTPDETTPTTMTERGGAVGTATDSTGDGGSGAPILLVGLIGLIVLAAAGLLVWRR